MFFHILLVRRQKFGDAWDIPILYGGLENVTAIKHIIKKETTEEKEERIGERERVREKKDCV